MKRIVKFVYQLSSSDNRIIQSLAHRCMYQCESNMGKNMRYIDNICNIITKFHLFTTAESIGNYVERCFLENNLLDIETVTLCNICKELIDIRDGIMNIDINLGAQDCSDILECICTK
jgi:hypothetical protein